MSSLQEILLAVTGSEYLFATVTLTEGIRMVLPIRPPSDRFVDGSVLTVNDGHGDTAVSAQPDEADAPGSDY